MGTRKLKYPDDFELLVELVVDSFQYPENPEWSVQADEEEEISSQLDAVKRLWPVLRLLMVLYPGFRNQLAGYVWEEEDEPAGLVMYQPTSILGSESWIVSTVAVMPEYRRRGIGRRLAEEALEGIRERGGRTVRLSVLAGNTPAYELYRSLGFEQYSAGTELDADDSLSAIADWPLPSGYRMVQQGKWDWQPRFELAQQVIPAAVQEYRPIDRSNYYPPLAIRWLSGLLDRIGGNSTEAIAIFRSAGESSKAGHPEKEVVAVGRAIGRSKPGGVNQLAASINPSADELAPYMLSHLGGRLNETSPGRRTSVNISDWQRPLLDAALEAKFAVRREWHDLGMKLD